MYFEHYDLYFRDVRLLNKDNVIGNTSRAFELNEREFGVTPMLSPDELASNKPLDRLGMLSYLACLHEELLQENAPSAKSKLQHTTSVQVIIKQINSR